MDNNNNSTDNFQQQPDDTNPLSDMQDNQQLAEDNDTPFSPPDGVQDRIDDTHPTTDTNIDPMERYDEGIEGAANIDLPGEAAEEDDQPPETEEE
ncbi:MAG: hypothetical protein M3Q36_01820 [bacterium]|nr:hypothetical protein [bacterium]